MLAHAPFAANFSLEASRETVNWSKYFLAVVLVEACGLGYNLEISWHLHV